MPTKIRLARHGRKRHAYYYIVVADSRAPRDGKFIERIGSYNPNTNPATIELDFDKALEWIQTGAQPTDTTRAILSYKGVMMKKHLLDGVKKGAFDEAEAEKKFEAWMREKETKIQMKKEGLSNAAAEEQKKRLAAEAEVNEKRKAELSAKNAELAAEAKKAAEAKEEVAEETAEEVVAEATETEEKVEEAPKAEAKAEEKVEKEPETQEKAEEAPKAEEEVKAEAKTEEKAEEKSSEA